MLVVPDPADLIVVRNAPRSHASKVHAGLWRRLKSANLIPMQRLRLLAALGFSTFDGGKLGDDKAPWLDHNPFDLDACSACGAASAPACWLHLLTVLGWRCSIRRGGVLSYCGRVGAGVRGLRPPCSAVGAPGLGPDRTFHTLMAWAVFGGQAMPLLLASYRERSSGS
jgi:hypothetical protein